MSEFLQLSFTSGKCDQSAFLATLYKADNDASHSGWSRMASQIFFRLMTRTSKSSQSAKMLSRSSRYGGQRRRCLKLLGAEGLDGVNRGGSARGEIAGDESSGDQAKSDGGVSDGVDGVD